MADEQTFKVGDCVYQPRTIHLKIYTYGIVRDIDEFGNVQVEWFTVDRGMCRRGDKHGGPILWHGAGELEHREPF